MKNKILLLSLMVIIALTSCSKFRYKQTEVKEEDKPQVSVTNTISIPVDKDVAPMTGEIPANNPDTVLTVTSTDEKFFLRNGQDANFIYGGRINPEDVYWVYEQTLDGYNLSLKYKTEVVDIQFERLCQNFIVASPSLTNVKYPKSMRYEQIIWTPREDGYWEVRMGTTERGCKSKALQDLQKLRNKDYDKAVPK